MSMQITLDDASAVQIADHGSDDTRTLVVISVEHAALMSAALERAARNQDSEDVTRHRIEDALLDAAVALINKARRAVQSAEDRALAGKTREQARLDALAKAEAEFRAKADLEVHDAREAKR